MSRPSHEKIDPTEETGVADVRRVREKIAGQYKGNLRKHIEDTNRIVAPLIKKLGLKEGVPPKKSESRSGTDG